MTISLGGSTCESGFGAGVFRRNVNDSPSVSIHNAASRLSFGTTRYPIYTDWHEINEDSTTISSCNGGRRDDLHCGVFHRRLHNTLSAGSVASRLTLITTEHKQPLLYNRRSTQPPCKRWVDPYMLF